VLYHTRVVPDGWIVAVGVDESEGIETHLRQPNYRNYSIPHDRTSFEVRTSICERHDLSKTVLGQIIAWPQPKRHGMIRGMLGCPPIILPQAEASMQVDTAMSRAQMNHDTEPLIVELQPASSAYTVVDTFNIQRNPQYSIYKRV
jgi:hypothetical protein